MAPVGIVGGMGPFAGAQYLGLFLEECVRLLARDGAKVTDQRFPPHYLFQLPVPDRTAALHGAAGGYAEVLHALSCQVDELRRLGARVVALACNTAHAWHADLQRLNHDLDFIHIGDVVGRSLAGQRQRAVGVLGTEGTIRSGIYDQALAKWNVEAIAPDKAELALLMRGIYDGVKANDAAYGRACIIDAIERMAGRTGATAFLMACTEIPLVLQDGDVGPWHLHNATQLSARALAMRALELG